MGDLGLNPRSLRDQANLVRGQLSHLESIAKQLSNSRNAARNPASWGLDADDRAIDPAYVGSALTAYNDITGAVASARRLLARIETEIAQQERASAESSSGRGPSVPRPSGTGKTPASGPSVTTSHTRGIVGSVEVDGEVAFSSPGVKTPKDYDSLVSTKPPQDKLTFSSEASVRVGVQDLETVEVEFADGSTYTGSEETFVGSTITSGNKIEVDDESIKFSNEQSIKTGVTHTTTHEYATDDYTARREDELSATAGVSAGTSVKYDEDSVTYGAEAKAELQASASTSGEIDNGVFTAKGEASATASVSATAEASAQFKDDGTMIATASAAVGATAVVAASGSVEAGVATLSGSAQAQATAQAQAQATATIGPDGLSAAAGVSAFAGVSASASASGEAMGVTGGVTGEVYAGIGVKAEAELAVTAEEVSLSLDLGVALGVGAGVSFDVSFSPKECWEDLTSLFW